MAFDPWCRTPNSSRVASLLAGVDQRLRLLENSNLWQSARFCDTLQWMYVWILWIICNVQNHDLRARKPVGPSIFILNTVVYVQRLIIDIQNLNPPKFVEWCYWNRAEFPPVAIIDGGCSKPKSELRLYLVCARASLLYHCYKNRYVIFLSLFLDPHLNPLGKRERCFFLLASRRRFKLALLSGPSPSTIF